MTLAVAYGVFFSFSVFFVPLVEEFRWSRALTAGALSVSTVVQGILSPLVGGLIDRIGPRPVILGGVVVLGGATMLTATVHSPWELYLYSGVLGATGLVALGWVPMSVLLADRVAERRGRMVGIAFSGMGVGIFAVGPLAQWLIGALGWRAASIILGLGTLIVLLPLAWLSDTRGSRPRPGRGDLSETREQLSTRSRRGPPAAASVANGGPTLGQALRTRAFWALFAAYFLTPLAVFSVFAHSVAFAVDHGFDRLFAASIFGTVGLMSSVGRVVFGLASDRFGGPLAATFSFGCTAGGALALVALDAWPLAGWLVVYAVLFGLGFGARGPIITTMATERFGGRRFGVIYGALNFGNGLGGALGPWLGGFVHDVLGSYRLAFFASIGFSVLGAGCFWLARRRPP